MQLSLTIRSTHSLRLLRVVPPPPLSPPPAALTTTAAAAAAAANATAAATTTTTTTTTTTSTTPTFAYDQCMDEALAPMFVRVPGTSLYLPSGQHPQPSM